MQKQQEPRSEYFCNPLIKAKSAKTVQATGWLLSLCMYLPGGILIKEPQRN
jgi:hypothetical protein